MRKDIKEMNAKETFKDIPNRFFSLIWNIISRWGLAFAATFYLIFTNHLSDWYSVAVWIIFLLFFLFHTDAIEIIERLLKATRKTDE